MIKKINILFISIFITSLVILLTSTNTYAAISQSFNINDTALYNETNTFNYLNSFAQNEARYDMSTRIPNKEVSTEEPLITVFTHGLGGEASHWSNVGTNDFAYSDDSLITRLARMSESNIYWIRFNTNTIFEIYNITNEIYGGINGTFSGNYSHQNNLQLHINDISKHTILVFEGSTSAANGNNDGIYTQFNYAISQVVYDIKSINNGVLPRMNLIGHSRGGITNMQYALDHPDLVDSIYSLGTPYTGSTSASLDAIWFNGAFANVVAETDIISETTYSKYMNRWNAGYQPQDVEDDLYSHINVMALAGYGTLLNLSKGLTTNASLAFLSQRTGLNENVLDIGIKAILGALNGAIIAQYLSPTGISKIALGKLIAGAVSELATNLDLSESAIDDFVQILTNEINLDYHFPYVSWYNDGLVDLGSQLGYEGLIPLDGQQYKGFDRITKTFTDQNTDFDNTNVNMPAVVHNLEARDKELGTYILTDISTGNVNNNEYETYTISDTEIGIDSYIGTSTNNELIIPSYINGKQVVAIGDYAFANNLYGKNNITSIIIPSSVKEIGKNAFYNSDYISNISFETNSELTTILEGAFSLIPNLTSFIIQPSVNYIGESVFIYSGITSFDVSNNINYLWQSNFLIDKNVTNQNSYIAIYANPEINNFQVPSTVKILSPSLFENNRNIVSINLNLVEYIGSYAFANSTLSTITGGNNIKNAGNDVFSYSEWQNNQNSEYINIGSVLIDYIGDESHLVIPEGITRIAESSFSSPRIESIVLPQTIQTIGVNAFTDCINLDWLLFTSTQPPILDGKVVEDDVTMFVKGSSLAYYQSSIFYQNINNIITTKTIQVIFTNNENQIIGESGEIYGTSFDQLIDAPAIIGKDFAYWIDQYGQIVNPYSYLNTYEGMLLKPIYVDSVYTLNIIDDTTQDILEVVYGEVVVLDIPFKNGYLFKGWYDNQIAGNRIINSSGMVVWERTNEIEYLYAQFDLIEYHVTYNLVGGSFLGVSVGTFTVEDPLTNSQISEIRKFGFVFDYWMYNNQEFVSSYNIFSNITLVAKWSGVIRTITYGTSITINDEYAIINMTSANTTSSYTYTIAQTVKSVTFIGSNMQFTNMKIIVSSRTGALVMGFESMHFKPKKSTTGVGDNAITSNSNYELYIIYKNDNTITGGEGADGISYYSTYAQATSNNTGLTGITGGQASNGGYGIKAYKVTLTEFDDNSWLEVVGGKGGNGGRGGDGQKGSDGVQSPNGSFVNPRKGDNGANGGIGGIGGRGGDGSYAIYVSFNTYLKVSSSGQYTLIGGVGGTGGIGGFGGNGGEGASDTSTSIWNGVGDPGNGGNGGRGGNGGSGGQGGQGSRGGYGGNGGSAGNYGDDGSDGTDGINGLTGSLGSNGTTGYNTQGTSSGISNVGYVYNKQFLQLM